MPRLEHLGFDVSYDQDPPNANIETETLAEKAHIFSELIRMEAFFTHGPGWYLSEVLHICVTKAFLKVGSDEYHGPR